MKSELPFAGVAAPQLRTLQKELFATYPLMTAKAWRDEVLHMFCDAQVRELRFVAIELAFHKPYRKWLTTNEWATLDTLVTQGAWWDCIDALAPNHYAHLLANEREVALPLLQAYAVDDNMWRRRVAILCQLKAKQATDETFLFETLDQSLDHPDFFVRKAIGWALRAHSRTNAQGVLDYITAREDQLSSLSKREGLKILKKNGLA